MKAKNLQPFLISINPNENSGLFEHIKNGVVITDEHSTILYINPAYTSITGYSKDDVMGDNPGMLHSGKHDKTFYHAMWQQISDHGFWEGEIWNRRKSGEIYPQFLTISKVKTNTSQVSYIGIFSDITFLKKDIDKNFHLAFYDPLTELPNRRLYVDRVNQIINKQSENAAIFYMDLDKFKQVNDKYGHCAGDKLLKSVGERLASLVKPKDTIARIGGDEFTAILTSITDKYSVTAFADQLVKKIEEPFYIEDQLIHVSISIGISFYPNDAHELEKLLAAADRAMYDAKKSGTKIVCYNSLLNA